MPLADNAEGAEAARNAEEYEATLELEELESLLEDLEEYEGRGPLPADLQSRLQGLGIRGELELRRRIADMHSQLDIN
jgi:hypothetical protein